MSLQRVFLTLGAMVIAACAPTMVADPPADHPASAQAATRELPVLTKLEAPAIAPQGPASQPSSQPASKKTEPDHSGHDAHQHHEGGHR